jgi:hypothetical protein
MGDTFLGTAGRSVSGAHLADEKVPQARSPQNTRGSIDDGNLVNEGCVGVRQLVVVEGNGTYGARLYVVRRDGTVWYQPVHEEVWYRVTLPGGAAPPALGAAELREYRKGYAEGLSVAAEGVEVATQFLRHGPLYNNATAFEHLATTLRALAAEAQAKV